MHNNENHTETMHCCSAMKFATEHPFHPIEYAARHREYILATHKSDICIVTKHCFHCGTTLPQSLRRLWLQTLWEKYKIEDPFDNLDKVPEEFLTDEWWKKLGYKEVEDSKCPTGAHYALYWEE